jgi:hypothetical protein
MAMDGMEQQSDIKSEIICRVPWVDLEKTSVYYGEFFVGVPFIGSQGTIMVEGSGE